MTPSRLREWIRRNDTLGRSSTPVVHLAADPEAHSLSGSSVQVATLAERYSFTDVDGRTFRRFGMAAENRLD